MSLFYLICKTKKYWRITFFVFYPAVVVTFCLFDVILDSFRFFGTTRDIQPYHIVLNIWVLCYRHYTRLKLKNIKTLFEGVFEINYKHSLTCHVNVHIALVIQTLAKMNISNVMPDDKT